MASTYWFVALAQGGGAESTSVVDDRHRSAAVSAVMGMGVVKLLGYLRRHDAEKEARQIIERAEIEVGARRKEAEVEAKELALREKAKIEDQLAEAKRKVFDRERHLDKQEDVLDQRSDQLQKQEKMVENNQRKLAEKLDDVNRRQTELDNLLDIQRQTLHQISGMNAEEAKSRLLEQLNQELSDEQGALIMQREKELAATCDVKARQHADRLAAAVRRRAHRRRHDQHGGHPQRRDEGADHRPRGPQHPLV